jgi:hypothetical protein
MSLVAALHADLDDVEARIKALYQPEIDRLREIGRNEELVFEKRNVATAHANGIASKLESITAHLPTLHMLIDNLHRDHPDADTATAAASTSTEA